MMRLRCLCAILVMGVYPAAQAQVQTPGPDSLSIMIGQMLLVGIGDVYELQGDEPMVQEVLKGRLGGIILYEKNIAPGQSAAMLRSLIGLLQLASPTPLWVGIDEEGGVVSRLKPKYGFMVTATAAELGTLGIEATRTQALRMAAQMRGLGFNLNFAPVVDLALNTNNTVIVQAKRSFSSDPKLVAQHAAAALMSYKKHDILGVAKHFPGHGSSNEDTHLGMTDVSRVWQFAEMLPYTYLIDKKQLQAIMTAHVINTQLDAARMPATLSRPIIHDALRTTLHFSGVVFSDDMQMRAIADEYSLEEAVLHALRAGVDVLLFSNNVPRNQMILPSQIHTLIKKMLRDGRLTHTRIRESFYRIRALKRSYGLNTNTIDKK